MRLEYKTLEEAEKSFTWSDRWEVFDRDRKELNIAYECVDRHPKEAVAIRLQNSDGSRKTYNFGELSRWTSQFANMLENRGIKPGDRIGIVLNPSLEYYISFFGTLKRGAVAVPCYALLGPDGIGYRFETSGTKLAVINEERVNIIPSGSVSQVIMSEELMGLIKKENGHYETNTSADTLAVIQFSSGTTGLPKQIFYKHTAMSVTAVFVKFWIGLQEGDTFMCTSSPAWGHGIWYGTIGPMIFGNGIGVYSGKFKPEILLEALEQFEITVTSFIPRVYKMIMDSGKIYSYNLKLRRLTYAGAAISKEVVTYFQEKLGIPICSCYGNTESGPIALDYAFEDYTPKIGSAGKAFIGTRIAILDDNGNTLPCGVTGQVAVWRNDKWNPIGDYGYLDEDGHLFPKGRSDDVIKSSGYRIGPFEIESVLEKHPAVQKAAVVGSPDEERGEIVKAFVIVQPDIEKTEELIGEMKAFVKERLSMHEYPREIEFVNDLPETPDGKLKRKVLKQMEYQRRNEMGSTNKWEGHARIIALGKEKKSEEEKHEEFTPEAQERRKNRANKPYHPRSVYFNSQASKDGIRHFVQGIGDSNPLFTDEEYARKTKYGNIIAPGAYLYSINWINMGYGGPGVHGWYSGGDWEWYRPIFAGDEYKTICVFRDLVPKKGKMGEGRTWIDYGDVIYVNQKGEIVGKEYQHIVLAERAKAGSAGKHREVPKPKYMKEDWIRILDLYDREEVRGSNPRYWEDVQVGDKVGPMIKGPLSVRDILCWLMGGGSPYVKAHKIQYEYETRHPRTLEYVDTGEADNPGDVPELVHFLDPFARTIGVDRIYDYGNQRMSWLCNFFTNWIGDDGFLWKMSGDLRTFNLAGDITSFEGKVVKKYREKEHCCVDIKAWAKNQRDQWSITPHISTVILPSKEHGPVVYPDPPAGLDKEIMLARPLNDLIKEGLI